jgi:hypothetical protein
MGPAGRTFSLLEVREEEKMKKYTGMGVENQIFEPFNGF